MESLKNDIMAMVVHDLKNPLSCIEAYASTIQSMPMDDKEREHMVARILSCSRWATSLVNDLMDAVAIESGKFSLNRRVVSLESIIKETVEVFEILFRGKGIQLQMDLSEKTLLLLADATRIRQSLHNLLANASKYVPEKGGVIKVAAYHFGGYAVTEVSDNGAGIDPDDQLLVFNKFFRKGPASKGSLGLGLFIARAIIEEHGGFIGVRSEGQGKGTTFHFSLPIFNAEQTYEEFKRQKGNLTPRPYKLTDAAFSQASEMAKIHFLRQNG